MTTAFKWIYALATVGWIAYFSLLVLLVLVISVRLFRRYNRFRPDPPRMADVRMACRQRRPAAVWYAGVWIPPGGHLASVLEVSRDEPAIVSGYGDGGRRRLTLRTFPQGTYYAIEKPGKPVYEIFIANDGGRVPISGGMIVGGVE